VIVARFNATEVEEASSKSVKEVSYASHDAWCKVVWHGSGIASRRGIRLQFTLRRLSCIYDVPRCWRWRSCVCMEQCLFIWRCMLHVHEACSS